MNNYNTDLVRNLAELRIDTDSVAIPIREYRRLIEADTAAKIILHAWDVAEHTWDVSTAADIVFGALWPKLPADEVPADLAGNKAPAPVENAGTAIPTPTPIEEMGPTEDPFTAPKI